MASWGGACGLSWGGRDPLRALRQNAFPTATPQPPRPASSGEALSGSSPLPPLQLPPVGTPTVLSSQPPVRTHSLGLPTQLPDLQTFWEHLLAEANPREKVPTADVVWRQTERDRV